MEPVSVIVQIPESWAQWVMAAFAFCSAVAAGAAAFVAYITYRSSRDPEVVVYAEHADHVNALDIVVRNVGGSAAYDVKLELDRELFEDHKPLNIGEANDKGLFKSGIPFLPPGGYRRRFWISNKHDAWFNYTDWVCNVAVSFKRKTWFGSLKPCGEGVYPIELDSFVESFNDDNSDFMRCMKQIANGEVGTAKGLSSLVSLLREPLVREELREWYERQSSKGLDET